MFRKFRFFILFVALAGCIEPYEFIVRDAAPSLVVEAFLSDRSFNETLAYPSDGRYFTVKLSQTGDVTNVRPVPVAGALVELLSDDGRTLVYTDDGTGVYYLLDSEFAAEPGIMYKLRISTPDENVYESTWEGLPEVSVPPMGEIGFSETEGELYVMEAGDWVLRKRQVVVTNINTPAHSPDNRIFYRWTFAPMWIYVAPLISQNDPVYRCWATDPKYFPHYELQVDLTGGYKRDLFSFPTIRNERIFERMSVLVTQHVMTEGHYNFWKELKDQNEGSALSDTPPYNLKTNFSSPTGAKRVSGYFGVVSEQAQRWYFDRGDLSYPVQNTLRADCLVVYGPGPPAEECTDCRFYSFGKATTTRPIWWQD